MATVLIELLVEDMPSRVQTGAKEQFAKSLGAFFDGLDLKDIRIESYVTCARLAVMAYGVPERTKAAEEERRGPRAEAAFDADGNPTKALAGFLRGCGEGVTAADVEKRETEKGTFVFYTMKKPAQSVKELLTYEISNMIDGLSWPKSMRWSDAPKAFIRPVEAITALWDDSVMDMEWNGISSGRKTRGHMFLSPDMLKLSHAEEYVSSIHNAHVILEQEDRLNEIKSQVSAISKDGAKMEKGLLNEVSGLVEAPTAVLGEFDESYLDLPNELLEITMAEHQRYFPIYDESGKTLLPKFVGVSNVPDRTGNVKIGYEKVLTARFNDAKFYWDMDVKTPLIEQSKKLEAMTFHKDLGQLSDKVSRMQNISKSLGKRLVGVDSTLLERAICLAKCDLVTGTVFEFPELQGLVGAEIAQRQGENEDVVEAIASQYLYDDFASIGSVAQGVILADRLDTLVGFYASGLKPTGSGDPFALRRAALSIIRVLREHQLRIPLKSIFEHVYDLHSAPKVSKEDTVKELLSFFMNRLQVLLKSENISADCVDAVFGLNIDDVVDVAERATALQSFLKGEDGAALHGAYKRAANILGDINQPKESVKAELLQEAAERDLFAKIESVGGNVNNQLKDESYKEAMKSLSELRGPIDQFFSDVMVMVDDEAVKQNRLLLLSSMTSLLGRVADFKRVSG
jgi:glycyl-tRNA synthetase beta chain